MQIIASYRKVAKALHHTLLSVEGIRNDGSTMQSLENVTDKNCRDRGPANIHGVQQEQSLRRDNEREVFGPRPRAQQASSDVGEKGW